MEKGGGDMSSWKNLDCELIVSVILKPQSPLLIQNSQDLDKEKNNVIDFLQIGDGDNKVYYIPGGSIKGVLRNHTEKLFYRFGLIDTYFGHDSKEIKNKQEHNDLVKQLFGDVSFRGKLQIDDGYFPRDTETEITSHTAIDRFRGSAKSGALYFINAITDGDVNTKIRIKNPQPWEIIWLCFLLRDLNSGKLTLGAKSSVGFGQIKSSVVSWNLNIYRKDLETEWNEVLKYGEVNDNYAYNSYTFKDSKAFVGMWEQDWKRVILQEGKVEASNE